MSREIIEYLLPSHPIMVSNTISEKIVDMCLKMNNEADVDVITILKNQISISSGKVIPELSLDTSETVSEIAEILGYTSDTKFFNSKTIRHLNFIDDVIRDSSQNLVCSYGYSCNESKEYTPHTYYISKYLSNYLNTTFNINRGSLLVRTENNIYVITVRLDEEQYDESILCFLTDYLSSLGYKSKIVLLKNKDITPDSQQGLNGSECTTNVIGFSNMLQTLGGKSPNNLIKLGNLYSRNISKHVVKSGFSSKCLVTVSWDVDTNKIMNIDIDCFGTEIVNIKWLKSLILDLFPTTFKEVKDFLGLDTVDWSTISINGYYGDINYPWEKLKQIKQFIPY